MRRTSSFAHSLPSWRRAWPLLLALGCGDVPLDDLDDGARAVPTRGAIRGTVRYQGPPPCSRRGAIVGSLVVMVHDVNDPPAPEGLGVRAANFVALPGDSLFPDQPRYAGNDLYCPDPSELVTTAAPFAVSPLEGGAYVVTAFYSRLGHFLPSFSIRNQPEVGDVVGGAYLGDGEAAQLRTLVVGRELGTDDDAPEGSLPRYQLPSGGALVDGVEVAVTRLLDVPRPVFHVEGADALPDVDEALREPVLRIPQDLTVQAWPDNPDAQLLNLLESSHPTLRLRAGVAESERTAAREAPFLFPVDSTLQLSFFGDQTTEPGLPGVRASWPRLAAVRLRDGVDDPHGVAVQTEPYVMLPMVALAEGGVQASAPDQLPSEPQARDSLRAMIRPGAVCARRGAGAWPGVFVAPHLERPSGANGQDPRPVFDAAAVAERWPVGELRRGCLPLGRYAITSVYPAGQSWRTPNEAGSCGGNEGNVRVGDRPHCRDNDRAVLLSQGLRGLVEVVAPSSEEGVRLCQEAPVPDECLVTP